MDTIVAIGLVAAGVGWLLARWLDRRERRTLATRLDAVDEQIAAARPPAGMECAGDADLAALRAAEDDALRSETL